MALNNTNMETTAKIKNTFVPPKHINFWCDDVRMKMLGKWAWGLGGCFFPLHDNPFTYHKTLKGL